MYFPGGKHTQNTEKFLFFFPPSLGVQSATLIPQTGASRTHLLWALCPKRLLARYNRHHRKHPTKTAACETDQFVRVPPTNATPQSTLDDGKPRLNRSAYVVNMTMRVIENK